MFDGIESVRALLTIWYEQHISEATAIRLAREEDTQTLGEASAGETLEEFVDRPKSPPLIPQGSVPEGIEIIVGTPIQDRGSVFIARVCRITHPSQASFSHSRNPHQKPF